MSRAILTSLVISLLLTIVLEVGFFYVSGKRHKKDLLLVVMVNIFTNPIVVMSYWLAMIFTSLSVVFVLIPLEIFAVLAEGRYYSKYGHDFKRPYLFSAIANLFSYSTGMLIQHFI